MSTASRVWWAVVRITMYFLGGFAVSKGVLTVMSGNAFGGLVLVAVGIACVVIGIAVSVEVDRHARP